MSAYHLRPAIGDLAEIAIRATMGRPSPQGKSSLALTYLLISMPHHNHSRKGCVSKRLGRFVA